MTQSRTHYIPVSGITIEKIKEAVTESMPTLDGVSINPAVYCPANGYIVPPDPAVLCPSVGYYDPSLPLPYIPPGEIPATDPPSEDDGITLICSNQYDGAINFRVTTSSGQYKTDIYDLGNTLIDSVLTNSNVTRFYAFDPSTGTTGTDGNKYYKVIITPATAGQELRTFAVQTLTGYAAYSWPIVEAHFKSPGLTSLADAFLNQRGLRIVKFHADVNNLTSLYRVCSTCSNLESFEMDVSANSLSTIQLGFSSTPKLENIKLPSALPALGTAQGAFNTSGIKNNPFPASLPEVTNMSTAMFNCKNLKGTVTLPAMPKVTNLANVIGACDNITKVVLETNSTGLTILTMAENCVSLNEIVIRGTWHDASSIIRFVKSCHSLKKLVFDVIFTGTNPTIWDPFDLAGNYTVEDFTPPTFNGTGIVSLRLQLNKLTSFVCASLKASGPYLYATSSRPSNIELIDVDWTTVNNNTTLRYGNLPTAEINRIFGLLPAASATIDVRNNPGYTTCDKTIATAKGWTVL